MCLLGRSSIGESGSPCLTERSFQPLVGTLVYSTYILEWRRMSSKSFAVWTGYFGFLFFSLFDLGLLLVFFGFSLFFEYSEESVFLLEGCYLSLDTLQYFGRVLLLLELGLKLFLTKFTSS